MVRLRGALFGLGATGALKAGVGFVARGGRTAGVEVPARADPVTVAQGAQRQAFSNAAAWWRGEGGRPVDAAWREAWRRVGVNTRRRDGRQAFLSWYLGIGETLTTAPYVIGAPLVQNTKATSFTVRFVFPNAPGHAAYLRYGTTVKVQTGKKLATSFFSSIWIVNLNTGLPAGTPLYWWLEGDVGTPGEGRTGIYRTVLT